MVKVYLLSEVNLTPPCCAGGTTPSSTVTASPPPSAPATPKTARPAHQSSGTGDPAATTTPSPKDPRPAGRTRDGADSTERSPRSGRTHPRDHARWSIDPERRTCVD